MLSSGTRIGPFYVESWIREGSCGQSYRGEGQVGEKKGHVNYLKLFHRDVSEKEGFSDFFSQECRAIQQLEGRGVWPMRANGKMKWKHWMAYEWFEGKTKTILQHEDAENDEDRIYTLRCLSDWMEFLPESIGPDQLKDIIIDIHCGLNLAHSAGVIHGNLKPSNILIQQNEENTFEAWVTEFALFRIASFQPLSESGERSQKFLSQSIQFQESLKESQKYRPATKGVGEIAEERWDLHALGGLVNYVIEKSSKPENEWKLWKEWSTKSLNGTFSTVLQSMDAIPGVTDLSDYGLKSENSSNCSGLSDDEIRQKREVEWKRNQHILSAKFRRNLTGLIGLLCLFIYLFSKVYLLFSPSPWVEYSIVGASDKYQLGFGLLSGKAWGILPSSYDHEGNGGQDVAGEWEREDGMFRLKFRKFKKINEEESGKKLWQFIGKGSTSEDDYYIWSDYLKYKQKDNSLVLIKRVDDREVFLPGKRGEGEVHLFPEVRIRRSGGLIKKAELIFRHAGEHTPSWSLFIGLGFVLASIMYHRIILNICPKHNTSRKD